MDGLLFKLFGLFFCALGGYFFYSLRRSPRIISTSHDLPTVAGEVLECKMVRTGSGKNKSIRAYVNYRYEVPGQTYKSRAVTVGGETTGRKRAEDRIATYPEGSNPVVTYNPQNPKEAFLERRLEVSGFFEVLGGTCGLALGLALVLGILPR